MVDTGSSHTVLSSDFLRVSPALLEHASVAAESKNLVGIAGWFKVTMQVGDTWWAKHEVLVMDLQKISNNMNQKIDGVLGEDILQEFSSVIIDFRHKRLTLLR